MRNGFIFKDRHSSDFGVTVRTKSRPILPSVKENIVDLPYRDGGYDFSKANPFGREFYNDRIFTVTFNIYGFLLCYAGHGKAEGSLYGAEPGRYR